MLTNETKAAIIASYPSGSIIDNGDTLSHEDGNTIWDDQLLKELAEDYEKVNAILQPFLEKYGKLYGFGALISFIIPTEYDLDETETGGLSAYVGQKVMIAKAIQQTCEEDPTMFETISIGLNDWAMENLPAFLSGIFPSAENAASAAEVLAEGIAQAVNGIKIPPDKK